jgi:hypothetical protein
LRLRDNLKFEWQLKKLSDARAQSGCGNKDRASLSLLSATRTQRKNMMGPAGFEPATKRL